MGSEGILTGIGKRRLGEIQPKGWDKEPDPEPTPEPELEKHSSIEVKKHDSIEVEKYSVKRSYYLKPSVAKKIQNLYIKRYAEDPATTYNQLIEEGINLLCQKA
jgi:hypothetical protein